MEEKENKTKGNNLVTMIVIAVLAAGVSFFSGIKFRDYQIGKTRANFSGGQFRTGGNFPNGQMRIRDGSQNGSGNNFQPVNGEIISKDDKSITVKSPDGSSKIVIFTGSTTINKAETGSKDDLKEGEKVFVIGPSNSDGSVNAQNIQLNPQDSMLFGRQD